MKKHDFNAIGVVEVNFYTNAVVILDEMLKTSDVRLVSCEKRLGGRMVTIIVGGTTSAVNACIEKANEIGAMMAQHTVKVAVCISNPHEEIIRLLNNVPHQKQEAIKESHEEQKIEHTEIVAKPTKRRKK